MSAIWDFMDLVREVEAGPFDPSVLPESGLWFDDALQFAAWEVREWCTYLNRAEGYLLDSDWDGWADTVVQYGVSTVEAAEVASVGSTRVLFGAMRLQATLYAEKAVAVAMAHITQEANLGGRGAARTGVRVLAVPSSVPGQPGGICLVVQLEAPVEPASRFTPAFRLPTGVNAVRLSDWLRTFEHGPGGLPPWWGPE